MAERLTKQQEMAVRNRGGKLLVSAAAGSGKTKVLVDRLMSYLEDPVDPANLNDFLIITADHGCDPGFTKTTDHTREYVPVLIYGRHIKSVNLGTKQGFCNIGKTICDYFNIENNLSGESFLGEIYE